MDLTRHYSLKNLFQPNLPYLAFDDRPVMLVGIPLLALVLPFLFFGIDLETYLEIGHQEYFEALIYTGVFWLFNRYLMIVFRKKFGALEDMLKRLLLHFAVILVTVPVISTLLNVLIDIAHDLLGRADLFEPTLLQGVGATYFLTFAVVMSYEAIYFFHKYKEAILEKERIQMAHVQGQLDNLRNQINPHFLFNSLNTLMNLIPSDPTRAMNYLDKLSKFYRYTVSNQDQQLVPLRTELENVKIYTELLRERFHEGIEISLPQEVPAHAQVLPLCLQLLIENAAKHNIVSRKKPLHIEVEVVREGQAIQVKNNIQRKIREVGSTGIGLKNIRSRIAFFTDEPLVVEEDEGYFKVVVPLL